MVSKTAEQMLGIFPMSEYETIIKESHEALRLAAEQFEAGTLPPDSLKKVSAPLGIYQQSNGLFMARIRVPGGFLTPALMRKIAQIAKLHGAGFLHLTTRQDVQAHGLKPLALYPFVRDCTESGLPFRGGGGDTFRNIICSDGAGMSPDAVFDIFPHVMALNNFLLRYQRAYSLPRKFKPGFSSSSHDEQFAKLQDLGFSAHTLHGKHGFTVYGGGGMGRVSAPGVLLFDFLPEDQILKCAAAMVNLFDEHGDRSDRSRARIRFIVAKMGHDAFRSLFLDYFAKTDAPLAEIASTPLYLRETKVPQTVKSASENQAFREWLSHASRPSRGAGPEPCCELSFFPKNGNLSPDDFSGMASLAEECGVLIVQVSRRQRLIFPALPSCALPFVHESLLGSRFSARLDAAGLDGLFTSCIGASVCKIGMLDAPSIACAAAAGLERFLASWDGGAPDQLRQKLLSSVRFSGCHNSCGVHLTSALGFQGLKRKVNDEMKELCRVFVARHAENSTLSEPVEGLEVPVANVPAVICSIVADYASSDAFRHGQSFADFVCSATKERIAALAAQSQ